MTSNTWRWPERAAKACCRARPRFYARGDRQSIASVAFDEPSQKLCRSHVNKYTSTLAIVLATKLEVEAHTISGEHRTERVVKRCLDICDQILWIFQAD